MYPFPKSFNRIESFFASTSVVLSPYNNSDSPVEIVERNTVAKDHVPPKLSSF